MLCGIPQAFHFFFKFPNLSFYCKHHEISTLEYKGIFISIILLCLAFQLHITVANLFGMGANKKNAFVFTGKVVEILNSSESRIIKVVCRPGNLLILTEDEGNLDLGEQVILEGNIQVEKIESYNKS